MDGVSLTSGLACDRRGPRVQFLRWPVRLFHGLLQGEKPGLQRMQTVRRLLQPARRGSGEKENSVTENGKDAEKNKRGRNRRGDFNAREGTNN